jgi:hypothetical protein
MAVLTETAAPTLTQAPTLTSTPTTIPTVVPSSTPIGGANGVLLFFVNPWRWDRNPSLREEDGLYSVNADGSGLNQILSRSQIEEMIGKKYKRGAYISRGGRTYISADGLYSVTDERQLVHRDELPNAPAYIFSADGKSILYLQGAYIYISGVDGSEPERVLRITDQYLGWSADGSTVYFTRDQGASMWAKNSDGSNERKLEWTGLESYTPYEGTSGDFVRRLDTYVVSPDEAEVAFTWLDLLFVADAKDLEFSAPRLIRRLPNDDPELQVYASQLKWSPDNSMVLVKLMKFGFSVGSSWGDIILVDLKSGDFDTIISSKEFNHDLCGFSPDGRIIVSIYHNYSKKESVLVLTSLDNKSSTALTSLPGESIECPWWQ